MTSTDPKFAGYTHMHTNRHSIRLLATITLVLITLLALSILSATPTFVLVPDQSDDIAAAIEAAIKKMRFTRWIARGRLKDTNPLYRTIEIDATADTVRFVFDWETTLTAPTTGEEIDWRYNGEKFRVSTRWESGSIRQAFAAFDGTRENLTTLDPDGVTLRVVTTVTSRMLPAPVKYTLVYRREEDAARASPDAQ